MALIDEVRMIDKTGFEKQFEDWYKKENLEKQVKESASKGYNGYVIDIVNSDKRTQLNLLFSHPLFKEKLQARLGEGFRIEYVNKRVPYKHSFIDVTLYRAENYLEVGWSR